MTTRFTKVGASIIAATIALGAPAFAQNTMVGGAEMFPNRNIVENAVNSADHTTLVAAVQAAGLVETLSGPGPFTVFAPTNAAFEKLPDGTVEERFTDVGVARQTVDLYQASITPPAVPEPTPPETRRSRYRRMRR